MILLSFIIEKNKQYDIGEDMDKYLTIEGKYEIFLRKLRELC